MNKIGLVLLAHGSRDPNWTKSFEKLLADLKNETENGCVRLAFMELAKPSLEDAVMACVKDGATQIRVLPLFMALGKHLEKDIPKQVERLAALHEKIKFKLLPSVVDFPSVYGAIKDAARSALKA